MALYVWESKRFARYSDGIIAVEADTPEEARAIALGTYLTQVFEFDDKFYMDYPDDADADMVNDIVERYRTFLDDINRAPEEVSGALFIQGSE